MKRNVLGLLVACALAVPILATTPAMAGKCSGQGNMHLDQKIGPPVIGEKRNVGFSITAKCTVGGGTMTATGTIKSASCGRMKGGKGSVGGKTFTFQGLGTVAVVSGKVSGVFNMVPDARKGDDCSKSTVDDFLVTVALNGVR
jgi:hypothetical protein